MSKNTDRKKEKLTSNLFSGELPFACTFMQVSSQQNGHLPKGEKDDDDHDDDDYNDTTCYDDTELYEHDSIITRIKDE